ncbi:MAG: hypothetical protein KJ737_10750 [Proteobacteria bacterium]|nr:hypothetical protein [Pseudomonadota bacterium]
MKKIRILKHFNLTPVIIGIAALIPGILVYFMDRPAGQIYFINHLPFEIPFNFHVTRSLGRIGYVLPDFIHAFSFSLITAGVLASGKKGNFLACLTWLIIDSTFEIGQKFGNTISTYIPKWFKGIPYLENTANYFRRGTFDWFDLLAILAGVLSAYAILVLIHACNKESSGSNPFPS